VKHALYVFLLAACGHATPASTSTPESSPCNGDPVAKEANEQVKRPRTTLASEFEGLPIAKIEVAGIASLLPSDILGVTDLRIGSPLTHEKVAKAIRAIYAKGDVDDVEVSVAQEGAGLYVRILVRERPRVGAIVAPGVPDKTRDEIAKALSINPGKRFDRAEVWQHERQVAEGMQAHGTSFNVRLQPTRGNKLDVCILVGK
jgi:outer membrane protein assembly factor BamA